MSYEDGFVAGRRECAEQSHRYISRNARLAEHERSIRYSRLAYENGIRKGALRALVAVAGLGAAALWLGRVGR